MGSNMNIRTYVHIPSSSQWKEIHKEGAESSSLVADEVIVFFFYPSSLPPEYLMFSLPTY